MSANLLFWAAPTVLALASATLTAAPVAAQSADMNFFLAPRGPSWGAGQPALRVSDQHCTDLAYPQGFGHLNWRVYLDGAPQDGEAGQVARNRIGTGPWYNYYGVLIAENVAQLHSDDNNLSSESAVTATGEAGPAGLVIPRGSQLDGRDFSRTGPFPCFGVAG